MSRPFLDLGTHSLSVFVFISSYQVRRIVARCSSLREFFVRNTQYFGSLPAVFHQGAKLERFEFSENFKAP